jgi:hypothetical protein
MAHREATFFHRSRGAIRWHFIVIAFPATTALHEREGRNNA